jgi:curved DNA-binding protein CbpA
MEDCDYYCTLGLERSASDEDIRRAYRRLARRFHPDVTIDAEGESKFKAVGEAYNTLRRADSRSAYNQQLLSRPGPGPWIDFPPDLYFALLPWPILTWLWWR